ncbi:MFS transporter [Acidicapsa acidisoli]|uniref:MFS transporter n=1 Tax=Acidicapsa acidisoli TaxID=1615681 RepID=UPI0021E020B5|nr:MFS transporter [Acidicapsa acidisoli]
MERLLESNPAPSRDKNVNRFWGNPVAWLRQKKLGQGFWVVFAAAFFFDFGMLIYVFMFNLYLLDLHFNDRSIGLVNGAAMLGSVAGTLPAGSLARRVGIRPVLIGCFVIAPLLCALRATATGEAWQIILGFLSGLAMCSWGVCMLPAVARTTTEANRPSAFSLIFSAGVGTGILGGVVCGYLPQWLSRAGFGMQPIEVKRLILLVSSGIAALGLFAVMRLPSLQVTTPVTNVAENRTWRRLLRVDRFLLRFLPAMALWTVVVTSFTPFANVYLSRDLHVPLLRIGLVFSAAQVMQFCVTLLSPIVFRTLGTVNGVVVTQLLTAVALGLLAGTQNAEIAVVLYLIFFGMQWMSSPGLYNLLMSKVPEEKQSNASSMALFCNALVGAASTAGAGALFMRFGYPPVLTGIAVLAVVAALLFWSLIGPMDRSVPVKL